MDDRNCKQGKSNDCVESCKVKGYNDCAESCKVKGYNDCAESCKVEEYNDCAESYKVIEHNDYIVAYKVIGNEHSHKLEHEEAHNLLKQVLLDYYQVDVNDLVVAKKEHGKPYFENSDIQYNISHCKGMVACAISRKVELGVDIEGIRPYRENVLRRVFTENEKEAFFKAEDKDSFFFKIWTFKESIIKCSGTGLSKDLRELDYFDVSLCWNQYEVLCENGRYILTVATGQ